MDAHHFQSRRNVLPNTNNHNNRTMCRNFWSTGFCGYGDNCIFAHVSNNRMIVDSSGNRNRNDVYPKPSNEGNPQRSICHHFLRGKCPFERCKFIHQSSQISEGKRENSAIDIQTVEAGTTVGPKLGDSYLKTKLCNKWKGPNTCPFNDKCTYAHGLAELRTNSITLSEHENSGTTSRAINKNEFTSSASKQPAAAAAAAAAAHSVPPKAKVCPFKWNNRKIVGIYGDWLE